MKKGDKSFNERINDIVGSDSNVDYLTPLKSVAYSETRELKIRSARRNKVIVQSLDAIAENLHRKEVEDKRLNIYLDSDEKEQACYCRTCGGYVKGLSSKHIVPQDKEMNKILGIKNGSQETTRYICRICNIALGTETKKIN